MRTWTLLRGIGPLAVALAVAFPGVGACGGRDFATEPGASVMVPGVDQVVFMSQGGASDPSRPPGGCQPGAFAYIIDPGAGELWWDVCTAGSGPGGAATLAPVTGSRTLSEGGRASLALALAGVTVSDRRLCGADKPQWELAVEASSFHVIYGDDFYGCVEDYDHFVTSRSLEALLATVTALGR